MCIAIAVVVHKSVCVFVCLLCVDTDVFHICVCKVGCHCCNCPLVLFTCMHICLKLLALFTNLYVICVWLLTFFTNLYLYLLVYLCAAVGAEVRAEQRRLYALP